MIWDARSKGGRPAHSTLGCVRGSDAAYLCVTSQPFNPEVSFVRVGVRCTPLLCALCALYFEVLQRCPGTRSFAHGVALPPPC